MTPIMKPVGTNNGVGKGVVGTGFGDKWGTLIAVKKKVRVRVRVRVITVQKCNDNRNPNPPPNPNPTLG
jgi:hypothetical protein